MCEIETARVFSLIGGCVSVALHRGQVIAFADGLAMPYEAFIYSLVKAMSFHTPKLSKSFLVGLTDLWAEVGMPEKYRDKINRAAATTMMEMAAQTIIDQCKDETPAQHKANIAEIISRIESERARLIGQA